MGAGFLRGAGSLYGVDFCRATREAIHEKRHDLECFHAENRESETEFTKIITIMCNFVTEIVNAELTSHYGNAL